MSEGEAGAGAPRTRRVKTAVVFIHGHGRQRPMETVRELARTAWQSDPELVDTGRGELRLWSTPDDASDIYELRRLATEAPREEERDRHDPSPSRRFDFFEYYWAHLMQGARFVHVVAWFSELLRKSYPETPVRLRPARQALIRFFEISALFAAGFAILTGALIFRFGDKPPTAELFQTFLLDTQMLLAGASNFEDFRSDLGELGGRLVLIFLAAVVMPLAALVFVGSNRRRRGAPGEHRPDLDAIRRAARKKTAWLHTNSLSLAAGVLFIFFVIASISPTFELRDLPALMTAVILGVFVVLERRHAGSWVSFLIVALLMLILFSRTDDGRVVGCLAVAATASIWAAWRMNFVAAGLIAMLTALMAMIARLGMKGGEALWQADFTPGFDWLTYLAWGWFFAFSAAYVMLVLSADARRIRRLFWFGAVIGVAVAGTVVMAVAEQLDYQPFAAWSRLFLAEIDSADLNLGHILHLHFWMTCVVGLGVVTLLGLVVASDKSFISPVMGDCARYLRPTPENIARRQKIREVGVRLLEKLHADGRYDRIVVVAHSLGSVVAYDILTHLWGRRCDRMHRDGDVEEAMASVEKMGARLVFTDGPEIQKACRAIEQALDVLKLARLPKARRTDLIPIDAEPRERRFETRREIGRVRIERAARVLARIGRRSPPPGDGRPRKLAHFATSAAQGLRNGPMAYRHVADDLREILKRVRVGRRQAEAAGLIERVCQTLEAAADSHRRFAARQADYAAALSRLRAPSQDGQGDERLWLVSDFITLGSPLHYGPFLFARSHGEFATRKADREFPSCPPVFEREPPRDIKPPFPAWRFSYQKWDPAARGASATFGPNHGALFGPVRWTNLYFETDNVVVGDVIGGPMWPHFDFGVRDVALHRGSTGLLFAHNAYWATPMTTHALLEASRPDSDGRTPKLPEHIAALRAALELVGA